MPDFYIYSQDSGILNICQMNGAKANSHVYINTTRPLA